MTTAARPPGWWSTPSGDRIRITDVHLHAPHGLPGGHMTAAAVRRRPILDGLINEYSQAA